jgi:hypothetical protein
MPETHLLFISKPTGYELHERDGEAPAVGDELDENGSLMEVVKVASSPLPGDSRRCAYLQALA